MKSNVGVPKYITSDRPAYTFTNRVKPNVFFSLGSYKPVGSMLGFAICLIDRRWSG